MRRAAIVGSPFLPASLRAECDRVERRIEELTRAIASFEADASRAERAITRAWLGQWRRHAEAGRARVLAAWQRGELSTEAVGRALEEAMDQGAPSPWKVVG